MKLYLPVVLSLSYCAVAWWGAQYFVVHGQPEHVSRPQVVQGYVLSGLSGQFEIHDNIIDHDGIWALEIAWATDDTGNRSQTICERQMEAAMRAMEPFYKPIFDYRIELGFIQYSRTQMVTPYEMREHDEAMLKWDTAKHDCWRVP